MRQRLRVSFATRLLAGGLVVTLSLIAGISAFLLISRDRQTRTAALSNADNRAAVIRQLLQRVSGATATSTATGRAADPALTAALGQAQPDQAVRALFTGPPSTYNPPHEYLAVIARDRHLVFSSLPQSAPQPDGGEASVRSALAGTTATGLELLGGRQVAFDAAAPVRAADGSALGAVLVSAPLGEQLAVFGSLIGYPAALIPVGDSGHILRLTSAGDQPEVATPPDIRAGIDSARDPVDATYSSPTAGGDVAGAFVPIAAPGGTIAGYVGVEAPLSAFVGGTRDDERAVGAIAIFVMLLVALLVIVFVDRFVRRPVARLERGVARIAGGDYATDIPVRSQDELGRLAAEVNRMRATIARNIAEIEEARARLDSAVERLGGVSRALTTTTGGVDALQNAVVAAAAAIAGPDAAAVLLTREDDTLEPRVAHGIGGGPASLEQWAVVDRLLDGRAVLVDSAPPGWQAGGLLAVPMFYQEAVVGALAVLTRPGRVPQEADQASLAVLANNAAIALENTRLFEQERETVRRLRELDAMKSDFMATVQHELRTPLTAIMGMSDLLDMCWEMWDDQPKLDAVHDIQVAAKNLYDIVETIIDFSLLEADTLGLNPTSTPVAAAVEQAVAAVADRVKGGMSVSVEVDVADDVEVFADPERLLQVLRALVDNAVKFTPEGGHVRITAAAAPEPGMVRISVADDGIGIPGEAMPRIFDRFFQVDNSATRAYGGTGMGLALVRRLVDAHGAQVHVLSEVGHGTTVELLWPALASKAAGEAREVAELRAAAR